jgi:hypothetical protein
MIGKTMKLAVATLALAALLSPVAPATAAPAPAWQVSLLTLPTHLRPGTSGTLAAAPSYMAIATNIGADAAAGPVDLTVTLPLGVTPASPTGSASDNLNPPSCSKPSAQTVTCTAATVRSSGQISVQIPVEVSAALQAGDLLDDAVASVESPGASPVTTRTATTIDPEPPAFDFLPGSGGLSAWLTRDDGTPAMQAGSHPDQLTLSAGFTLDQPAGPGTATAGAGHPRDIVIDLPPGVVVNPRATEVRCTEAEMLAVEGLDGGCPPESQVGIVTVVTEVTGPLAVPSPLYNMVPPPGSPATFAFDVAGVGIFQHLGGGVRSDGDYGLSSSAHDILARALNPVMSVQAQLWGDPSAESHDEIRGACLGRLAPRTCPVAPLETPFLTMPSACSQGLAFAAHARSWEEAEQGISGLPHHAGAEATTVGGESMEVSGCSLLDFEPTLTLQPNTSAAESPTGVRAVLHVPQNEGEDELATSNLKDVVATLPAGMAVNPASAAGLDACTPAQAGLTTPVGQQNPIHFTNAPDNCPDAAKIGTVEVSTPLLDHPLPGAVYVASPHDNPFATLLAIYISVKSPADGLYAKLAGKVTADPSTGQLTTTFTENPELPVEDFKLDFFGGPRAALRTPSDCGGFATTATLTPWSGNPAVHTSDGFQVSSGPNGSGCTANEAQRPNAPGFEAGTKTPLAAAYSPFVMNLSRADGQQLLKGLDLTLPPGLTGKLSGLATCSDAAIAAASAKSGRAEQTSPSCPASSLVGEVTVAAGVGSVPYYTKGKIYLAGPYQGGPISLAIITPAVAGPYDLGDVVVRAAAHLNPVTAQIAVHSDPLPTILQGIPLQLREIRVAMNKPDFTLNPTSCDPMAISGQAVSLLGQITPLNQRFQVGGCKGLDFEPKLSLRLKGGTKRGKNPALRAVLTMPPGNANIAKASVALPHSEFLDQSHIRTVCTRVQFAAGGGNGEQCPAGSVYGKARAFTPLLDNPLEGPVYLRSSSHPLPDLVAALQGPATQPIEVVLAGRVDSVNEGIRNTFEAVPDQPVSKFVLEMQGGKKGLLINSRDLCKLKTSARRAVAKFDGQNGGTYDFKPVLQNSCKKKHKKAHTKHRGHRG